MSALKTNPSFDDFDDFDAYPSEDSHGGAYADRGSAYYIAGEAPARATAKECRCGNCGRVGEWGSYDFTIHTWQCDRCEAEGF